MGTGSVEGIEALAGTPCAVAGRAGVAASNITSALSKKLPMGVPMEAKISSVVGWYMEIGLGLS